MRPTGFLDFNYDNNLALSRKKSNYASLSLQDQSFNVFDFLPRNFTISTNNSSHKFNIDMLKDTSSVILQAFTNDPQNLQYHLDINDEKNVMEKIEHLYLGKKVIFSSSEILFTQKVSELLNLTCFPNFLKPYNLQTQNNNQNFVIHRRNNRIAYDVQLSSRSLITFITNTFTKQFKIITNGKDYMCNIIGIQSSNKIRSMIEKEPNLDEFIYEIDDESDDFQQICQLFNFESITITTNNMNSLKQFSEDLQIECILNKIDKFVEFYENAAQTIDDKQTVIDEIDEIFDLLYNRSNETVENVYNSIITSKWSKTEDNIIELAAIILNVVRSDFVYHSFLIELIIKLDKEEEEEKKFKILIPTIIKQLMNSLSENKLNCAFIYKLYKKGFITNKEIADHVHQIFLKMKHKSEFKFSFMKNSDSQKILNSIIWFYPEINEIYKDELKCLEYIFDNSTGQLFQLFLKYTSQLDAFKLKRDLGEPDDSLTKAIINDDLDTVQKIIFQRNEFTTMAKSTIPYNLFDSFILEDKTSYINYAAARGSVRCFKYFLLNDCKIDNFTLQYAVFGENYEIIRIVDQYYTDNNILIESKTSLLKNLKNKPDLNLALNPILPAIMKHQNDIFDWILQEKFLNQKITGNNLSDLLLYTSENGNAHALIKFIDNGLDLNLIESTNFIYESLKNGFLRYTRLILNFITKSENKVLKFMPEIVNFGNLSIFQLALKKCPPFNNMDQPLLCAISKSHFNIIKYIVGSNLKLTKNGYLECLNSSIRQKSGIFQFLLNEFGFEKLITEHHLNKTDFVSILCSGCQSNNFENVKILTDLIIQKNSEASFTNPFIISVENGFYDIYKYFIDKNVYINLFSISKKAERLTLIDVDVFCELIKKADPEMKDILLCRFLCNSLTSHNKNLVEYLMSQKIPYENSLFDSISSQDIEIVKIVLKYNNEPSFINQISEQGTALYKAVFLRNPDIVSYLLTIKGIDPNLYQQMNQTPLILAITNLDMTIINLLLDFYGDEIEKQMWQLNEGLDRILEKISGNENQSTLGQQHLFSFNQNKKDEKIDHKNVLTVIKRLLGIKNLDLNIHSRNHTLLTYACLNNDLELVEMLIEFENVNINSYSPKDGNTPLMIAIECRNSNIAKHIIESPRSDINLRNYNSQSALTIAVETAQPEIVSLLINNEKFDPIKSRLDYAFFLSTNIEISNLLLSLKKIDVNFRLINNQLHNGACLETSLIYAVKKNDFEKVKIIINNESFDPIKSQIKLAIFIAAEKNNVRIFRELLPLIENDVNISIERNISLLIDAVKNKSELIITDILNNEKFDPRKSEILTAFVETYSLKNTLISNRRNGALLNSMNLIYNYDVQHSHLIDFAKLLPNGKSYFTSIRVDYPNIDNVIQFLLNNGVGPDIPDSYGVYPLEHAINLNSYPFVQSLIETRSIDFKRTFYGEIEESILNRNQNFAFKPKSKNIKSNNSSSLLFRENLTYLHLAAKQSDNHIFNDLLNLNVIDINSPDDQGETPLFIAIRYLNGVAVQSLFILDNLDYKHQNKNGQDAVKFAYKMLKDFASSKLKNQMNNKIPMPKLRLSLETKGEHMSKILEIINFLKS